MHVNVDEDGRQRTEALSGEDLALELMIRNE